MLRAGRQAGIPVLIGSAGTAGGDAHVNWTLDIAREVAKENEPVSPNRSDLFGAG